MSCGKLFLTGMFLMFVACIILLALFLLMMVIISVTENKPNGLTGKYSSDQRESNLLR